MEKVVVAHGYNCLEEEDMRDVNAFLEQGWAVKTVKTTSTEKHVTAVFVLEKKTNEDGDYSEEVGEVYLHDDPFDV